MTPKIIEAWSGPGKKDGTIGDFLPEYDALHIDINKFGHSEWWYFDARLDNGYFIVAFFRARHERTGKTGVEITIYKPNGEKLQKLYNYPRTAFSTSGKDASISIGQNYIKVDFSDKKIPKYEIFIDEEENGLHLIFTAIVPGWMPGKGYTEFEDLGQFGWCIALPRANVEGTIKLENQEIKVKGIGYHDHNWITFNPVRVVTYWYWGRVYSDNFTIIYAHIKLNKKLENYEINVLMAAKGPTIIMSTGEFDLIQDQFVYNEDAKNNYPKILKFKISEENSFSLEVQEVMDAGNLLFELPKIIRFIAGKILRLNPGYFRFSSNFQLDFQVEGTNYKETGTTLHEMVIVKPE